MRILQICPFDIPSEPASGGAIRISEIAAAYTQAGCIVDRCTVVPRARDTQSPLDIHLRWIDRVRRPHIGKPENLGPIRQMWAIRKSDHLISQLRKKLTKPYDVIQVEHPWDFDLAMMLKTQWIGHTPLVAYSAHNIESILYKSIWTRTGQWNRNAATLFKDIEEQEKKCAQQADICWAVSEKDAAALFDLGGRNITYAPNGCRKLPHRQDLPELPKVPYALFVGGAYLPNAEGFIRWVGPDLEYIPKDSLILVVGGVCSNLKKDKTPNSTLNPEKIKLLGIQTQQVLDQLIKNARAILLPIDSGGGTNLKTSESIISLRPIIATETSFRGFEKWKWDAGVYIESNPDDFKARISSILSADFIEDQERSDLTSLTWGASLKESVLKTINLARSINK